MENNEKLYIVSYGNSTKFRVMYPGSEEELEKDPKIKDLSKKLKDYLEKEVKIGSQAESFSTPKIIKPVPSDKEDYSEYPDLLHSSFDEIKKVLLREVQTMQSVKEMNKNAPFGDDTI